MRLHQLQRIDQIGIERRDNIDGEEDRLTIGTKPNAVAVLLVVTGPVEKLVRLVAIIFGELPRQLFIVPGMCRTWPGLIPFALAEINDVDDFLPVERNGQCLTERLVCKHLAHFRVFVGDVQVNLALLRGRRHQSQQAVVTLFHVLRQGRLVGENADMALLNVDLAGNDVQHQRFHILRNAEIDFIDIG